MHFEAIESSNVACSAVAEHKNHRASLCPMKDGEFWELSHVGDGELESELVRLLANAYVAGFECADIWARSHIRVLKHLHASPKTLLPIRNVEGFLQLVFDREVRRDYEDTALGHSERQDRRDT